MKIIERIYFVAVNALIVFVFSYGHSIATEGSNKFLSVLIGATLLIFFWTFVLVNKGIK